MQRRIAYLDGWRAVAVAGVLFAHLVTPRGLNAGRLGVEMFFVLSGRLMAEILFVRDTPLPVFYARRISRIVPALLVAILGIFALSRVVPIGAVTIRQLIACLTLTYNYAQLWIGRSAPVDHLWTLCVEEHAYLMLGMLALLARKSALPVLPVLTVLIVAGWAIGAYQTVRGEPYAAVYWRSDVRVASVLVGAAAYLWLRSHEARRAVAAWVPLAAGCIGVALSIDAVPDPVKYSLGTLSLAACVCLLGHAPGLIVRTLGARIVTRIGLASFSIYLWQQPFHAAHPTNWRRGAAIAGALVVGALSYRLIEAPARRALNRLSGARRDPVRPSEA